MKKLLLLISFTILFLYSFTQIDIQRDNRVNPILKWAVTLKSDYITYGRSGSSRFINIAVINQSSHTISWFTCHGRLFDSTKLTDQEYELVTSKQLDPFVLYQNICDSYVAYIAAAKDNYRVYGDKQLFYRLNPNYRALFAMESVQAAKTPLQKLIAIENVRKNILTQLAYLNCGNPFGLTDNLLYKTNKEQAGTMIQTKDSTVYYNIDPTSAVVRISLYKKSPEKLYVFNRLFELIDSVPVLPEKYNLLLKENTDVFLLYRGWLELQWQDAMSNIRKHPRADINDGIQDNEALYVPSTSDKGRGGLFFTSSSGGFNHSSGSLDENDAIPINLDLLVTVAGGFPGGNADTEMSPFQYSGDEVNKLTKLVEVLKSDKKFMEKVDKILESVKTVLNTEGAGEKKGQAMDEFLQKVNDTEKSNGKQFLQCESCGAYRKVGTKQVLPATKKDTANKGITTQNTTKIKVQSFHSN
jgi:hypothetical protein